MKKEIKILEKIMEEKEQDNMYNRQRVVNLEV